MVNAFSNTRVPWTMLASIALHGGVAVMLAWRISSAQVTIPIGVEWRYVSESAAPAAASLKPAPAKAISRNSPAVPAPEATAVQPAAGAMGAVNGEEVSALERYKFELRLFLESRKLYPEIAKRLHQTGTVIVKFKVNAAGDLNDINIEQASSSEILNRAALDLIRRASKFRPFPEGVGLTEFRLSLPIEYIL